MNKNDMEKYILGNDFEKLARDLYSLDKDEDISFIRERYLDTFKKAYNEFSDGDYHIISSPGRAEICGNHTDHQNGFVVATALDIDNICFIKKNDSSIVRYKDVDFNVKEIDIKNLDKRDDEVNRAESIIRGVAKRLTELNYCIGGFDAFCDSNVLVGSGMSSSACFEVMIVEIFNTLYNSGKINPVDRAKISRWAENNYFGKPCGLMDQMAISVGSFVGIDFKDKEEPKITKHEFNFKNYGYNFYIINTKGNHVDLTDEYAAIPGEMKKVASYFKKEVLSEVDEKEFYNNISVIRDAIKNDRAVLRAMHYFQENKRAKAMDKALNDKDIKSIISIMKKSGESSFMYLQNVYPASHIETQSISIALAASNKFINDGVCRVQGGGFAGTIQAVVNTNESDAFISEIRKIFGDDSVLKVRIRKYGTVKVI